MAKLGALMALNLSFNPLKVRTPKGKRNHRTAQKGGMHSLSHQLRHLEFHSFPILSH